MLLNTAVLSTILAGASAFNPAFTPTGKTPTKTSLNSAKAELEDIAKSLNPVIGYYDPLGLADAEINKMDNDRSISFLRAAEIKHGRVAMAAFVGYCVQSNWHWPFAMDFDGNQWPSIDLSPEAQWDALPLKARYQIIAFAGVLEWWDTRNADKRDQPGKFPSFTWDLPNLYDPFMLSRNASEESKARGRLVEINNGRLAMLGIIGFVSADTLPGSVPLLDGIAIPYDGNIWEPFAAQTVGSVSRAVQAVVEAAEAPASSGDGLVDRVIDSVSETVVNPLLEMLN